MNGTPINQTNPNYHSNLYYVPPSTSLQPSEYERPTLPQMQIHNLNNQHLLQQQQQQQQQQQKQLQQQQQDHQFNLFQNNLDNSQRYSQHTFIPQQNNINVFPRSRQLVTAGIQNKTNVMVQKPVNSMMSEFIYTDQSLKILYGSLRSKIIKTHFCAFPENDLQIKGLIKQKIQEISANSPKLSSQSYMKFNSEIINQVFPIVENMVLFNEGNKFQKLDPNNMPEHLKQLYMESQNQRQSQISLPFSSSSSSSSSEKSLFDVSKLRSVIVNNDDNNNNNNNNNKSTNTNYKTMYDPLDTFIYDNEEESVPPVPTEMEGESAYNSNDGKFSSKNETMLKESESNDTYLGTGLDMKTMFTSMNEDTFHSRNNIDILPTENVIDSTTIYRDAIFNSANADKHVENDKMSSSLSSSPSSSSALVLPMDTNATLSSDQNLFSSLDHATKSLPISAGNESSKKIEYQMDNLFLEVSSADRKLNHDSNHNNRFSFSVGFEKLQNFNRKSPIFENHPFVIENNQVKLPLEKNDSYDQTSTLGNIVGYSSQETTLIEGLNVQSAIHNVVQIIVDTVLLFTPDQETITFEKLLSNINTTGSTVINYPYILLEIDELRPIYRSSNEHEQKNVIKLYGDKTYGGNGGGTFSAYRPISGEVFSFVNSQASLGKLTFRLRTPQGELFQDMNDIMEIENIKIIEDTDYYFEITLKSYTKLVYINDNQIVHFSNLQFFNKENIDNVDSTNPDIQPIQNNRLGFSSMINFLEKSTGHVIVQNSGTTYHNTFRIRYPYTIDLSTGHFTEEQFDNQPVNDLMTMLDDTVMLSGVAFNETIQTHISMRVLSRQSKSFIFSENVKL